MEAAPYVALAMLGCGIALTIAVPPRPLLVWNASASAPVGLYRVGRKEGIEKGDMVIARLAKPYRSLAARRRYLPANVPLVKRVAALPGDYVCAHGNFVFVDGAPVAARLGVDARGRAMPWWRGCVRLGTLPAPAADVRQPGIVRRSLFRAERAPRRDRSRLSAMDMVMLVAMTVAALATPIPAPDFDHALAAVHRSGGGALRGAGRVDRTRHARRKRRPDDAGWPPDH